MMEHSTAYSSIALRMASVFFSMLERAVSIMPTVR